MPLRIETINGMVYSKGPFIAKFADNWSPEEMIVEAGGCELPLSVNKTLLVKDGSVISNNVNRLVETPLSELAVIPEVTPSLHTIEENTPVSSESNPNTTPPPELLKGMKPDCIEAFVRMWERLPTHLRDINFGLQHDA